MAQSQQRHATRSNPSKSSVDKNNHPRVSYNREEMGKGSHEGTLNVISPDAVQIDAGVCRGGSGHGAASPAGCQAGGGLPFWQEREVMRRVTNRNPSAWLFLSVKSLSLFLLRESFAF